MDSAIANHRHGGRVVNRDAGERIGTDVAAVKQQTPVRDVYGEKAVAVCAACSCLSAKSQIANHRRVRSHHNTTGRGRHAR